MWAGRKWPIAKRFCKTAEGEGKYIKQTGGRGQYGHVKLTVQPLPNPGHEDMHEMSTDELDALAKEVAGKGGKWRFDKEHRLLFIDKIVGGSIPREFIRSDRRRHARSDGKRRPGRLRDGGYRRGR